MIFGSSKPARRRNCLSDCRLSVVRKPLWSHDESSLSAESQQVAAVSSSEY